MQLSKLVKQICYHAPHSCLELDAILKTGAELTAAEKTIESMKPNINQSVRLLVVEDNETNLRLFNSMLGRLGYSAVSARNGRDAVELLQQQRFDIIFMDCQMPVMDGYQATAEIRRDETDGARAIIIAMTGNAMAGERERCITAGMDDFIPKPVRLQVLADVLSNWLQQIRKI